MAFGKILKLSAMATAMMLAGCGGGDIVLNTGAGATPTNKVGTLLSKPVNKIALVKLNF